MCFVKIVSFLRSDDSALLIVAHGSTVNPDSSAPTLTHAAEIRRRDIFGEVQCAFWNEEPRQAGLSWRTQARPKRQIAAARPFMTGTLRFLKTQAITRRNSKRGQRYE